MIKINLLPHREERRKQRKQAFVVLLAISAIIGAAIVLAVGMYFSMKLSDQQARNSYTENENARLDTQIKEVASLKQEIDALKARQQAVEDLQSDRNQPVYLMDELAQQVPEGVYLKSFKQDGQRVLINGYAQSNERVSELLRNLGNRSPWLERPDLIEIRSAAAPGVKDAKNAKSIFELTVNATIRRPRDQDATVAGAKPVAGKAAAPASPKP